MSLDAVGDLVQVLRAHALLAPEQLEQLDGQLKKGFTGPKALAADLLKRGWLTAYQVNQLFLGRADQLTLGNYVLLERLGEGAMGQVFKARHQRLHRIVALKQIRKDRVSNPVAVQRFQREIQVAAQLSHPNIVLAYDADEVNGVHFFTMEYVEGKDLSRLVKEQGPLRVWQACDYIRQAALGLQHAHERGLVHRDMKPSNLLLTTWTPPGSKPEDAACRVSLIKLVDLGLARLLTPPDDGMPTNLTRVKTVLGTVDFLAPEQARDASSVDIRADLYGLGCTLYYLLAGQAPFAGSTATEKVIKHWSEEPTPVEQVRRQRLKELRRSIDREDQVPPAVAALVRRLMAKRPEDRYQTPAETAAALTALLPTGTRIETAPAGKVTPTRRRWLKLW